MNFEEQTARIERLIWFINNSNTGTAEELAKKLGVSRRTIFSDLEYLKGKGHQIIFCQTGKSYLFIKE